MPKRERGATEQQFVDNKLDSVLSEAGLPVSSPLRGMLDRDAEVFDGATVAGHSTFGIKVSRDGREISLAERLEELRHDPLCRHNFPTPKPKVASTDMRAMSENFDAIRAGKVVVER